MQLGANDSGEFFNSGDVGGLGEGGSGEQEDDTALTRTTRNDAQPINKRRGSNAGVSSRGADGTILNVYDAEEAHRSAAIKTKNELAAQIEELRKEQVCMTPPLSHTT